VFVLQSRNIGGSKFVCEDDFRRRDKAVETGMWFTVGNFLLFSFIRAERVGGMEGVDIVWVGVGVIIVVGIARVEREGLRVECCED